jgi:hypothetical protein
MERLEAAGTDRVNFDLAVAQWDRTGRRRWLNLSKGWAEPGWPIGRPCGSSSRCMSVSTPPYFGVCASSAAGPAPRPSARSRQVGALGAKWLKIIFVRWQRHVPYDEQYHLATMTHQQLQLRQPR